MLSILAKSTILLLLSLLLVATATPLPNVSPRDDVLIPNTTNQATIKPQADTNPSPSADTNLTISATIFTSVPGPKSCRGSIMTTIPAPASTRLRQCYNLPYPASCGVFTANKEDGCEARLFAEPGCVGFVNLAVFMPELRPVGGSWRSVSVKCGIPAPDPATLGAPPLQGLMAGARIEKKPSRG